MAIDPPYRLDPFRSIINVHFETTVECPQEGEGYPGIIINADNYGVGSVTSVIDFYMAVNSTGPHASGNPLWPAEDHPGFPAASCVDAGILLDEAIGTGSGTTYVSAVSVSIPYVINPETGGPSPEAFALMVSQDWDEISDYIDLQLSYMWPQSDADALRPYIEAAFETTKQKYYEFVATQPDGQQQSSDDTAQTDIAICGETA